MMVTLIQSKKFLQLSSPPTLQESSQNHHFHYQSFLYFHFKENYISQTILHKYFVLFLLKSLFFYYCFLLNHRILKEWKLFFVGLEVVEEKFLNFSLPPILL